MRNFKENHNEMNWPWVESPFFKELINHQNLSESEKEIARKFNEDGYVIIDLGLSDEQISNLGNSLRYELHIEVAELDANQSKFF
jgi:hypothetical protein